MTRHICLLFVTILIATSINQGVSAQTRLGEDRSPTTAPGRPPATNTTLPTHPTPQDTIPAERVHPPTRDALPAPRPSTRQPGRALPPRLPRPGSANATYESGEVLVVWRDKGKFLLDRAALSAYQTFEFSHLSLAQLQIELLRYRFPDEPSAQVFRALIQRQFPDADAERNWHYSPVGVPRQYSGRRIGLTPSLSATPLHERIGMLDTSVQPSKALAGSRLIQRDFLASHERAADPSHGTAVASLMVGRDEAAAFIAPAFGASLYVGSVMRVGRSGKPETTTAMLLGGLDWLLVQNVSLINLSLGGPGDTLLQLAISRCVQTGTVLVAAAGNGGPHATATYPAAYANVMAVTASDAEDEPWEGANQGDYILISAPGVEVWAPDDSGGAYLTGTSFASAFASAIIAKLRASAPMKPEALARWLCLQARDLGKPGRDSRTGCGLLQWRVPDGGL